MILNTNRLLAHFFPQIVCGIENLSVSFVCGKQGNHSLGVVKHSGIASISGCLLAAFLISGSLNPFMRSVAKHPESLALLLHTAPRNLSEVRDVTNG